MPLTSHQIDRLAAAIAAHWAFSGFTMFAKDYWELDPGNLAPNQPLKVQARTFISDLNSRLPPGDRDLLVKLRDHSGVPALAAVAKILLEPPYLSPTEDPHDAILLGRAPFVDRAVLRDHLREFTNPTANTTHVLIIRGDGPCGKTYSWSFLRHLAKTTLGAEATRVQLAEMEFTEPEEFVTDIFLRLGLDPDRLRLPALLDKPQPARTTKSLVSAFIGQARRLQDRYWLVIDDINDEKVIPEICDAAYAIARSVEHEQPANLWVVLIGYNEPINDEELSWIKQDDARFPNAELLAKHFEFIAATVGCPITPEKARGHADDILGTVSKPTKAEMISLTKIIESVGERLRLGQEVDLRAQL
jgi:hypothetical protein